MPRSSHITVVALLACLLWPAAALGDSSQQDAPAVPESAYAEGAVEGDNPRVEARLLVGQGSVEPGDTVRVGVLFRMDPHWHIYWRNSGDSGMATQIGWSGEGLDYDDLQWPAPTVFSQGDGQIITFGYGDEVLLFTEATAEKAADDGDGAGDVTVKAEIDYLVCKIDCIPGAAKLERSVQLGKSAAEAAEADETPEGADLFASYGERVPKAPEELGIAVDTAVSQTPIRPGDNFRAAIGLNVCRAGPENCRDWEVVEQQEGWAFVPDTTAQVDWTGGGVVEHPNAKAGQVIRLKGKASPNAPKETGERLSGIVHLKGADGQKAAVLIDEPLPRGPSDAEVEEKDSPLLGVGELPGPADGADGANNEATGELAGGSTIGFWQALLFAFLGGLILNLMPCVFPVLALKVSSFAKLVHEDRRHILAHGGAYTGGIVGSMLVLAAVVLGLRLFGTQVGWGFQFQNPLFPALLAGVLVLFAMNLFGVYELNVGTGGLAETAEEAGGLSRSFLEGVLAVVLATPCSAPFLGTAMGFALAGSALTVVTLFSALGVGLAAPFVVLTLVPGWSKVLPNPGNWMVYLKQLLGFTLVGATIWLVWIVGRATGVDGMARLLMFLGVVSLSAWIVGQAQSGRATVRWSALAAAVVLMGGAGAVTLRFDGSSRPDEKAGQQGPIAWEPWSQQAVDAALQSGRPVFVDFTADWCITCKYNEQTVLATEAVVETFEARRVKPLKADWSDGDETIRAKLAEYGKAGVPMYLVYSPNAPENPVVLPEMLSADLVVKAVRDAVRGGDSSGS